MEDKMKEAKKNGVSFIRKKITDSFRENLFGDKKKKAEEPETADKQS